MQGRICYLEGGGVGGEIFSISPGVEGSTLSQTQISGKNPRKCQLLQPWLITCFNYFYGPGGQRNCLVTFYYVVFVKIIGLYVSFESLLRTL